jgi:hypothetical protein
MPIVPVAYKTISCDGPSCTNSITFLEEKDAMQKLNNDLPWFKTLRMVQNSSGRNFVYCSDTCELGNVAAGAHNPEERKQIVLPTGANTQQLAAAEAQRQIEINKALHNGPAVVAGS